MGFALGVTALVAPVVVAWKALKLHWWVMMAATAAFMFMVQDLRLTGLEGAMLLAGGALYLGGQIWMAKQDQVDDLMEEAGDATKPYPMLVAMLVMGCVGLFFGSEAFVRGAAEVAMSMGISNHAVGVTVVAFGTSVPEIAASLTAAIKGNNDLSIGNLVGSNILNILLVLGATASWGTLKVDPVVPVHDMWWMLGAATLLAPLVWLGKGVVNRWGAALYILVYGVYVALVLVHCS